MSNEDIPPSTNQQQEDQIGFSEFASGLDAILNDQLGTAPDPQQLGVQAPEDQPKSLEDFISKKAQGQILPNDDLLRNMIREEVVNEPVDIEDPEGNNKKNEIRTSKKTVGQNNDAPEHDKSIKMLCEMHGAPAAFFSQKEDRYVCFKCLVNSEQLLYIDKSYKHEMEDFERIKSLTEEAIKSNIKNTTIIATWKCELRKSLMKVRNRYIRHIDNFIYQFSAVFKNVDKTSELAKFEGEDKKLTAQTDDLHTKYLEIMKIFNNIANSSAQKRINYIDHVKQHMRLIEKKVREQDAYIKSQAKILKEAIDKTVSLDGVEEKIESKLIKYLTKESNKNKKTNRMSQVVNPANMDDTTTIFQVASKEQQNRGHKDERRMFTGQGVQNDYGAVNPKLLESMELSVIQQNPISLDTQYNDSQIDKELLGQLSHPSRAAGVPKAQEAKIHKYKHKGLNSLYFLPSNSQSIFLLDFKR